MQVGYTTPDEYGALIRGIRENVEGIENLTISLHGHNDLGLAVANFLSGVENGARQVGILRKEIIHISSARQET